MYTELLTNNHKEILWQLYRRKDEYGLDLMGDFGVYGTCNSTCGCYENKCSGDRFEKVHGYPTEGIDELIENLADLVHLGLVRQWKGSISITEKGISLFE